MIKVAFAGFSAVSFRFINVSIQKTVSQQIFQNSDIPFTRFSYDCRFLVYIISQKHPSFPLKLLSMLNLDLNTT
ncbi:hypothetical protein PRUPE_6G128700 [Prunus persica]|uniref:Uncharacterized protein n=1 Tax=Prunus persica TaxID=3760 RepID=M5WAJ9_PRUPE|nr:hypothetical protein PRUPE_6G128700 [Prunus persica]